MNDPICSEKVAAESSGSTAHADQQRICGPSLPASRWLRVLFLLSGLVPFVDAFRKHPDSLLIYTVFVLACLFRRPLAALADRLPGSPALHLLGSFILFGWLAELFAWMGNYSTASPNPGLLHPQLFANLILAVGLYTGWAIAWLIVLRWYRFTLAEAMVVTGLQGIVFEGLGRTFIKIMSVFMANPLLAVMMAVYLFLVHGSFLGAAIAPVLHQFDRPDKSRHWIRYVLVIVLVVGLSIVCTGLMGWLTLLFGGLPPKRSIIEHPLW